jgi:hypothetical protein
MGHIIRAFIAVSPLIVAPIAMAEEPGPVDVLIFPFEISGDADPAFAHFAHQRLSNAVAIHPRFQVPAHGEAAYHVKGHVHADNMRHFVGLMLLDAGTGKVLWCENFDYLGITPEMMAEDLIQALKAAPQSGGCK